MARTLASLLVRLEGDASRLDATLKKSRGELQGFTKFANRAGLAALAVGTSAIAAGAKLVKMAGDAENTRKSFEVFTGSAESARKLFDDLNKLSIPTPFTPEQYQAATKTLLGFGESLDNVRGTLGRLGNVAAGVGQRDLSGLALVYGQVIAQQKAYSQDLNQFINQGVPIFDLLAQAMDKPRDQIKKLASEGKVTSDVLAEAFRLATAEGGKFEGAMAKQAKTFNGLISVIEGQFNNLLRELGDAILPAAKIAAEALITAMDSLSGVLDDLRSSGKLNQISAGFIAIAENLQILARNVIAATGPIRALVLLLKGEFTEAAKALAEPITNLGNLMDDAGKFADSYNAALVKLNGVKVNALSVSGRYSKSLEELTQKTKDLGGAASGSTEEVKTFATQVREYIEALEKIPRIDGFQKPGPDRFSGTSTQDLRAALPDTLTPDVREIQGTASIGSRDIAGNVLSGFQNGAVAEGVAQTIARVSELNSKIAESAAIAEPFNQAFVGAIGALPELIGTAIESAKSFGDIWKTVGQGLKQVFRQLIADLIKTAIRMFLINKILSAIFPGSGLVAGLAGGGGLSGGLLGGVGSLIGSSGGFGNNLGSSPILKQPSSIEIYGKLSGRDIYLSNSRAGYIKSRTG